MKLLFDVQTNSTDVVRAFLIIFVILVIFFIVYSCNKPFRLWFNDCLSFTKPQKYWSRRYDNVPQFIRSAKANPHVHEKIQNFLSAMKKPFKKNVVVQQPTSNTNHEDDKIYHFNPQQQALYV